MRGGLATIRGAVSVGCQLAAEFQAGLKCRPSDTRLARSVAVQSHSICSPSAAQDQLLPLRGTHATWPGGLLGSQRSVLAPFLERSAEHLHRINPTVSRHGHWPSQPLGGHSAVLHQFAFKLPLCPQRVGSIPTVSFRGDGGILRQNLGSSTDLRRACRHLPGVAWTHSGARTSNSERLAWHGLIALHRALLHGSARVLEGAAVKESAAKSAALAGATVKAAAVEGATAPRKRRFTPVSEHACPERASTLSSRQWRQCWRLNCASCTKGVVSCGCQQSSLACAAGVCFMIGRCHLCSTEAANEAPRPGGSSVRGSCVQHSGAWGHQV